jgi:hypothetical protein
MMKFLKYLLLCSFTVVLATACNKGIDPITKVEPGTDASAPVVTISYPTEGTLLRVKEDVTSININLSVTDDIEIQSISVKLDGTEITKYISFKDYRIALEKYLYNNVTNGTHTLTITATDLSGKSSSKSVGFEKAAPYKATYSGEVFYMPFDGDFMELLSCAYATKVGSPDVAAGKKGTAYIGASDSYLTFPSAGIVGNELSIVFWYKVNASPDRAGIISISPTGEDRAHGFRFAREASGADQHLFLNFGNGTGETWMNPFATITPDGTWKHIGISISGTHATTYIDGVVATETDYSGPIDWTGCSSISIGSGAPNFAYWGHAYDKSLIDELRMFNKALSATEVQTIYNAEK